ncbi:MAG: NAD(+)--dinitrogen-reductase ADP-D-ribosyltransferase [Gammaproteobacteria bacterium]|nr:NAD(+)--dinitrogen-reductase ADP-D-ribosyltransferase [Gammaproteobacteria bacterium]
MHDDTTQSSPSHWPALPAQTYLPINRCNLPAAILGSLSFQRHPVALALDGVAELHRDLWQRLEAIDDPMQRAVQFMDYMAVHFLLEAPEAAGYQQQRNARIKLDYRQVLRGWMFDADNREGAVLKGWVESRFGLLPIWHKGAIISPESDAYRQYLRDRTTGIYNTNALEAQLDVLYSYCQYELTRFYADHSHLQLFRGINPDMLGQLPSHEGVMLFNNLNACSQSQERADEFGSLVYRVQVPRAKVFYFSGLLPGLLQGEDEYLVIGGLYDVYRISC